MSSLQALEDLRTSWSLLALGRGTRY